MVEFEAQCRPQGAEPGPVIQAAKGEYFLVDKCAALQNTHSVNRNLVFPHLEACHSYGSNNLKVAQQLPTMPPTRSKGPLTTAARRRSLP